jgi:hypothetical protein
MGGRHKGLCLLHPEFIIVSEHQNSLKF